MTDEDVKKVAIVTGAASGIGSALVKKLHFEGIEVLGVDLDSDGLDKVRSETDCATFVTDISTSGNNIEAAQEALNKFGRLDYAFLNAGILGRKIETQINPYTSTDLDPEFFTTVRAVNFDSVVFGTLAVAPLMEETGGGSIVATASIAGLVAWNRDPFYTATKHAVVGWVRGVASGLQNQGISINAICPGGVATPLVGIERLTSSNPNLLAPEKVGEAMCEIAMGDTTGQAFTVKADHSPLCQEFTFTSIEGFPT
ncbi:MAG: SDR family NAD(P)-dependent oxidoreductase [Acidimicrobiales bacterium]|nr:SDR family NAD(P)-dependent oxidoreductase [Acidimicrobiales bacterium]